MLTMAAPKKPQRLSEKFVRFPKILECDSIELDSLEEYSGSDEQDVRVYICTSSRIVNITFNLNSFHFQQNFIRICCHIQNVSGR